MIGKVIFVLLCLYLCQDNIDRAVVIVLGALILW